jgi:hypothetical protein
MEVAEGLNDLVAKGGGVVDWVGCGGERDIVQEGAGLME